MARLIAAFIRHGDYHQLPDTPSAHQPFPLNEQGQRQARAGAAMLRDTLQRRHWRLLPVIDSSQMLRAWQTAQILAQDLADLSSEALSIESFDALAERGLGCAANLSIGQIEQILRQDPRYPEAPEGWKADSHYRLPLQGAESLLQAGERVAAHVRERMHLLSGRGAQGDWLKLFVGHGAALRHAAFHLGVLEFEQIAKLSMRHAQPVFIEQDEKGRWRHIDGHWKVRSNHSRFMD
jgi:2,3-bisphosphoglycerate-dependent phosphoglycerate mutase